MQTNEKNNVDTVFFSSKIHLVATKLVPVISTANLVVWRLIDITHQAHTLDTAKPTPKLRVAQ
jgi:hypothetical protein